MKYSIKITEEERIFIEGDKDSGANEKLLNEVDQSIFQDLEVCLREKDF